jgi:hypothetical protein
VTQSIAQDPPFVYISESLDNEPITIIEDHGMRDIFPSFTDFIDNNLGPYHTVDIPFSAVYRYSSRIENSSDPIRLYSIRLGELKALIASSTATSTSNSNPT